MCCLIIVNEHVFRGVTQTRLVVSPIVFICELSHFISLLIGYISITIHIICKHVLRYM